MAIKVSRRQVSQTVSIPAPVGGLNGRDAIANMAPTDAPMMDNWYPVPSAVQVRNGSKTTASGLPAQVHTLATYNGNTTTKMFAASGSGIYDVTTSGAVGAPVVTGLTNTWFQYVQMGTIGGRFLCMFNGSDNAKYYDGTSWIDVSLGVGATQINNVDPKNIINVNIFKNRMWLVEKNTAHAWYMPLNAIYGNATQFDLSPIFSNGSTLVAMATWTIDNANGLNEFAVFVSNTGEVVVYQGSDPSVATDFTIHARFSVGRPAGYRCLERVGSDLVIVGADGAFPLSKALVTDRSQQQAAITDKIVNLVSNDVQSYGNNLGWQIILYPIGSKILINVPYLQDSVSYQYVMNSITGAWCRFTGWNAFCFARMGDNIYYGGNTKVYQCDVGTSDDGSNIQADCQQAFQYFGNSQQKLFTAARPIIYANGNITPSLIMNIDFDSSAPTNVTSFANTNLTPWGSPWGSPWTSGSQIRKEWQSITGYGFAAAPRMAVSCKNTVVSWQSTDVVFQTGETL